MELAIVCTQTSLLDLNRMQGSLCVALERHYFPYCHSDSVCVHVPLIQSLIPPLIPSAGPGGGPKRDGSDVPSLR